MEPFARPPGKSLQLSHLALGVVGILLLTISACGTPATPLPLLDFTPTQLPTASPTATIDWFPATATPTKGPTIIATLTQEPEEQHGDIILSDDFSEPEHWLLGTTSSGLISLGINELTIAISEPGGYANTVRRLPLLDDFEVEIATAATLCKGEDQYGLLLRMSSPNDFYRFALSCDGRVRLDKIINGTATSPQPWIQNSSLPPGAPLPARLGVRLQGDEMSFYVNDTHQFTINDPALKIGNIGLFARSVGENAVTVNFSDLIVREVTQ